MRVRMQVRVRMRARLCIYVCASICELYAQILSHEVQEMVYHLVFYLQGVHCSCKASFTGQHVGKRAVGVRYFVNSKVLGTLNSL